jgi:1-acyl-sn-glycerol-3-phosphate acyltransferase
MRSLRDRARLTYRAAGFAGVTFGLGAIYAAEARLAASFPPSFRRQVRDDWTGRWSRTLLALFGVEVERYTDVPPRAPAPGGHRGRLVVANHRSTIDIGLLLGTFGGRMVSRADLGTWPILGPAARGVGTLFVERARATSGAELIRSIRDELKAGDTVNIFPEGTTFAEDQLRPFHPGAFAAAYRTGAEIVPVGIAYQAGSNAAFVDESFLQHLTRMSAAPPAAPRRVGMWIGEPIATDGRKTAELSALAFAAVERCVTLARARVDR